MLDEKKENGKWINGKFEMFWFPWSTMHMVVACGDVRECEFNKWADLNLFNFIKLLFNSIYSVF